MYDLLIKNGLVVDGTGANPVEANIGIQDGVIVYVGDIDSAAKNTIDAKGLIVTPGFVDIHTHYDGQVTWCGELTPSSNHGVTTAVMGNCGVGFAPCRPNDKERLISLMEGVEDIPHPVLAEGLPWDWETFPEYLDSLSDTSMTLTSRHRFRMGRFGFISWVIAAPIERPQLHLTLRKWLN